jgi:hypothetical protein
MRVLHVWVWTLICFIKTYAWKREFPTEAIAVVNISRDLQADLIDNF